MLVIDPTECIDCALCEPECPVKAIYSEDELPEGQRSFLKLNAELAKQWPPITQQKAPPADVADWKDVREKLHLLERG
jgi:ferredoxin